MATLLALFGPFLHLGMIGLAVWLFACERAWLAAVMAERTPAPFVQPWRDIMKAMRKRRLPVENESPLFRLAPIVAVACSATAVVLIPGYALELLSAPIADGILILGLLAFGRIALILGVVDTGSASGADGAHRAMTLATMTGAVGMLVVIALAVVTGTTNLDGMIGLLRDSSVGPSEAIPFMLAALAVVACVDLFGADDRLEAAFAGRDWVLVRIDTELRLVGWVNLLGGLCLPWTVSDTHADPIAQGLAAIGWLVRSAACVAVLSLVAGYIGKARRRQLAQILGVAGLGAVLSMALTLLSGGAT